MFMKDYEQKKNKNSQERPQQTVNFFYKFIKFSQDKVIHRKDNDSLCIIFTVNVIEIRKTSLSERKLKT